MPLSASLIGKRRTQASLGFEGRRFTGTCGSDRSGRGTRAECSEERHLTANFSVVIKEAETLRSSESRFQILAPQHTTFGGGRGESWLSHIGFFNFFLSEKEKGQLCLDVQLN